VRNLPILVTGASGKLGAYVVRHLVEQQRPVIAWSGTAAGEVCDVKLHRVELTDADEIRRAFREATPAAVVHCAALSAIGECYRQPQIAEKTNVQATELLGHLAERMVYTSTDLVFDGCAAPYAEDDEAVPLSLYGKSKLAAEHTLKGRNAAVVRVSLMYGPALFGSGGFFEQQVNALQNGESLNLFRDEWRTPLSLDDAAQGLVQVLDSGYQGTLHLGGPERLSREEMGRRLARQIGADESLVRSVSQGSIDFPEPRPSDVSLNSKKARDLLGWKPKSLGSVEI
jgi:dTDP-4-dehydrorhamnose reductase